MSWDEDSWSLLLELHYCIESQLKLLKWQRKDWILIVESGKQIRDWRRKMIADGTSFWIIGPSGSSASEITYTVLGGALNYIYSPPLTVKS